MTCLRLNNEYYEALARDEKLLQRTRRKSSSLSYCVCFEQEYAEDPNSVYSVFEKIRFSGSYSLSSGTRTYDSKTARWLSRDSIAEQGGYNLYGFIGNDGVNKWDYLGYATYILKARVWKVGSFRYSTTYGVLTAKLTASCNSKGEISGSGTVFKGKMTNGTKGIRGSISFQSNGKNGIFQWSGGTLMKKGSNVGKAIAGVGIAITTYTWWTGEGAVIGSLVTGPIAGLGLVYDNMVSDSFTWNIEWDVDAKCVCSDGKGLFAEPKGTWYVEFTNKGEYGNWETNDGDFHRETTL